MVDTYGSYASGFLHVSKQPEAAVAVLHNDVLPFYRRRELEVKAVLTDNGREFCGTERHAYELYLDLNGIEHRRTKVRTPKTNGFVERFNGTVLDEFFRVKMRETFYESVEALQADPDAWLHHYNTERPHLGYRNQGRRPIETINLFVSQEDQEDSSVNRGRSVIQRFRMAFLGRLNPLPTRLSANRPWYRSDMLLPRSAILEVCSFHGTAIRYHGDIDDLVLHWWLDRLEPHAGTIRPPMDAEVE